MHSHTHGPASGRVLAWSLAATSAFVVIELIAGLRAHSLALVSDAGHNATDALALSAGVVRGLHASTSPPTSPARSGITGPACWQPS